MPHASPSFGFRCCRLLASLLMLAALAASCGPIATCWGGTTSVPDAGGPNFELDVMPILSVAGCNSGHCHGKSRGQNGFALSLLGFDADFDYASIVEEGRGRR